MLFLKTLCFCRFSLMTVLLVLVWCPIFHKNWLFCSTIWSVQSTVLTNLCIIYLSLQKVSYISANQTWLYLFISDVLSNWSLYFHFHWQDDSFNWTLSLNWSLCWKFVRVLSFFYAKNQYTLTFYLFLPNNVQSKQIFYSQLLMMVSYHSFSSWFMQYAIFPWLPYFASMSIFILIPYSPKTYFSAAESCY